MRGNPFQTGVAQARVRSIPAYAGEPRVGAGFVARRGVYPRVCGGTDMPLLDGTGLPGLSPRMRGNPGAGQPPPGLVTVYPRVCGGTRYSRRYK